ncbi:MAG: cyclohexanone monooxygenase [Ilumatobacter sp.]|jgi:cation diffusion facilitator CzcD-associated flavoprotein CzcO
MSNEVTTNANSATATYDAVIVGAGFAGMYMLHKMRGLGMTARVFDAAEGVGGTWYWNRYPGARCDVMSHDYSFSFDDELQQEWEWSEKYATQPEILRYANHVADRYELWPDMQFETRIASAAFDDDANRWSVLTDQGEVISAQHVVMATGTLSAAKEPDLPGCETFAGETYMTSKWPHEGVDFTGKTVGIIGTGSSAIQSIPIIAEQAAHLTVFQRTPNFSLPAGNCPTEVAFITDLKKRYPSYRQEAKESFFGVPVEVTEECALEAKQSERNAKYQAGWDTGSLVGVLGAYADLLFDKEANDTAAEFVREKVRATVNDPELAELLCPDDYPFGTKRPCLDTGYYETFNSEDVRLVDLRKTPLVSMDGAGISTTDEHFDFDVVVYATGFDAMTGAVTRVDISGVGGKKLVDEWVGGPQNYLGLCVAGFPNFYVVTGPGSPSVLSNMMVSIEQHVEWISDLMEYMRDNDKSTIDPTPDAQEEWVRHVAEAGDSTLYPLANSWYMGANVPGKPRVFLPYIGGCGPYRETCDEIAADGYRGFALA